MKKIPETDVIFERLADVNTQADADETILRLSIDTKATILIGEVDTAGWQLKHSITILSPNKN